VETVLVKPPNPATDNDRRGRPGPSTSGARRSRDGGRRSSERERNGRRTHPNGGQTGLNGPWAHRSGVLAAKGRQLLGRRRAEVIRRPDVTGDAFKKLRSRSARGGAASRGSETRAGGECWPKRSDGAGGDRPATRWAGKAGGFGTTHRQSRSWWCAARAGRLARIGQRVSAARCGAGRRSSTGDAGQRRHLHHRLQQENRTRGRPHGDSIVVGAGPDAVRRDPQMPR